MKLLVLFSLLIAGCGGSTKNPIIDSPGNKDCTENYIILENLADQNKPIPVLAFHDSSTTIKEFPYARDFALNRQMLCGISEGVRMYSDTSWVKPHALYKISLIDSIGAHVKFVNTDKQLKNLFDYLEEMLKEQNLYEPYKAVYDIRRRLLIPH